VTTSVSREVPFGPGFFIFFRRTIISEPQQVQGGGTSKKKVDTLGIQLRKEDNELLLLASVLVRTWDH